MTIEELYKWAVDKGFEKYPIKISKVGCVEDVRQAELVTKDSLFNGIFYDVDTETIILR